MFVENNGLSAKDITRIPMGTSSGARIAAIKSGSLQAAVLDPGGMIVAEKEGLHSLAFLGDLFPLPFQGYVVTDKKIAENPAQIKRWVRAMSRALMFLREQPRRGCGYRHQKASARQHQSRHADRGIESLHPRFSSRRSRPSVCGRNQEHSRVRGSCADEHGRASACETTARPSVCRRGQKRIGTERLGQITTGIL
jgi:ABC-type nitrate/sulfonate/bicarbonate transport system substrate-binding protein